MEDLKVKEVAELLNISESTVQRLLEEGKIPAYQLNREYRFNRSEIEDWLIQQKMELPFQDEEVAVQDGTMKFSLYRALYRGDVLELDGETKEEIIRQAMHVMAERFDLDADVLTDLFLDRERMMPTALNCGIGVPHTRDFLLDRHYDVILVVYPKKPVEYGALDRKPVHTLFCLFACEDRNHLNLLSKIAHLGLSQPGRDFFASKPSREQLLDYVKRWESSLSM